MGISATTAGYTNTGHDIHMTIVNSAGGVINIENVMQFDARQETQDVTRVRLDNRILVADLPKLWTGTITYDRGTGGADKAIAQIERDWYAGLDYKLSSMIIVISTFGQGDITTSSAGVAQTTSKVTGGLSAFSGGGTAAAETTTIKFIDVALRQTDSGTWRGDDATSCRLEFRAARRIVNDIGSDSLSNALNLG